MKFIDRVKVATTTTGTGAFALGSAVSGFQSFAGYALGELVPYTCVLGAEWESGIGTKTASTVERTTVTASSNGGALVNFSAGSKDLFVSPSAEFLNGVEAANLAPAGALNGTDIIPIVQNGVEVRTTLTAIAVAVAAINGGTAPATDTTAPTLSSPTGTSTGTTTASGTVSTSEANGTLYFLAATTNTATAAAVKAGSTQAVTTTGVKNVSVTGLTASTLYYLHFLHRDAAGNDSTVTTSASFTTAAATDTTAPILSAPLGTQTGATTASGGATTNEANGTLYRMVSANATETAATIKAANLTAAVTATGAQVVSFTGLTASTQYYAHYVHRDAAGNDSNVVSSAAFTTAPAGATAYTITGYSDNTLKPTLDISNTTTYPTYSGYRNITAGRTGTSASFSIYWSITATSGGAMPASAKVGWGTSSTVPPDESVTAYLAGTTNASVLPGGAADVYVTMGKATAFDFDKATLWVPAGAGTVVRHLWIKPVDGVAQMIGSITITGA